MNKQCIIILTGSILFIVGCRQANSEEEHGIKQPRSVKQTQQKSLPRAIKALKNVHTYAATTQAPDTLILKKEHVFKSDEDFFFDGFIGSVAVDDQNRVYITAGKPNEAQAIYIFKADGQYLTKTGRIGKGPGEFLAISSIVVQNGYVYVYDPRQYKISIFSVNTFSHSHDLIITKDSVRDDTELATLKAKGHLFVRPDQTFLIGFQNDNLFHPNKNRSILYYRISKRGKIIPGRVLKLKRYQFFTADKIKSSTGLQLPFVMPFSPRSLIAVASNGDIYANWSKLFLIKVFDEDGHYKRAFYYNYKNSTLDLSSLRLSPYKNKLVHENADQLPATWPALYTVFFDDQDRLWVFTISDSKTYYKGWVLNKKGELLARFNWPGQRASQSIMSKPVLLVKNGFLYKRQIDLDKGLNQVVKYKIQFKRN